MIAHQYRPVVSAAAAGRQRSCRLGLVERMAETIREMAFAGETVSSETLAQRGFSAAAVARYGAEATAIARRRSIRQLATDQVPA